MEVDAILRDTFKSVIENENCRDGIDGCLSDIV